MKCSKVNPLLPFSTKIHRRLFLPSVFPVLHMDKYEMKNTSFKQVLHHRCVGSRLLIMGKCVLFVVNLCKFQSSTEFYQLMIKDCDYSKIQITIPTIKMQVEKKSLTKFRRKVSFKRKSPGLQWKSDVGMKTDNNPSFTMCQNNPWALDISLNPAA